MVWRAIRISNWRISHSMKLRASKWTHFLSHLCVNTWYFLMHFVFCHFHYKYDYANGILCHNSCSTSFHSLTKTPLYIYLGVFFCECIIDLSRWFWVNLLFFAKYFWGYSCYMSCSLCYVKSRIYFVLLIFFTHAFMCLLSVTGIYRLIQSCCCLHLQLIDSSLVELFLVGLFL